MLFNSATFLFLFLPLALGGFYLLLRVGRRPALAYLVLMSFVFYGWWNPVYVPLLLLSIAVNFGLGHALTRAPRRSLLVVGVAFNLGLLGVFKYADFFLGTVNALFGRDAVLLHLILPLAISFFTFQQIAFLVDVYRRKFRAEGLLEYALFVSFFPQLIAGPIVNYARVIDQFRNLGREVQWQQVAPGLTLFTIGLFKKVVLADSIAPIADRVFGAAAAGAGLAPLDAWGGTLAYTLQLYFDFSGYSDMALGLAHLFGIRLPINFDTPYQALSISAFWRRWHITLGAFLRDYLYIPLGGNRRGWRRTQINVMITMLLGGLWHGAGWTFVLWGGLHGTYLVIENAWRRIPRAAAAADRYRPLLWLLTFCAVMAAWVLFRAPTVAAAGAVWSGMLGLSTSAGPPLVTAASALLLVALLAVSLALPGATRWARAEAPGRHWRPGFVGATVTVVLALASIAHLGRVTPFLYFNF